MTNNINKKQVLKILNKYFKEYDLGYTGFGISINEDNKEICIKINMDVITNDR